jgi:hypothetical protein
MGDVEDTAQPIVSAILKVVPATRWAFARVNVDGKVERLLPIEAAGGLDELASELKRQREISRSGPRIAARSVRSAIAKAALRSCSPTSVPRSAS